MDRRDLNRDDGASAIAVALRAVRGAAVFTVVSALTLGWLAGTAFAHGGSLGGAARESPAVPSWLLVGTGGAVVGASFLLSGFATDRRFLAAVHATRWRGSLPRGSVFRVAAGLFGVVVLAGVVVTGFVGPTDPLSNPAVVVVWAGWWAGYAMTTYLLGNTWPALNPWRAVARALPDVGRTYRWRWGAWPGVAGLLGLVWLEVVSPLVDQPRVLAVTVVAYSVVTVAGAVVYGTDTWFRTVDPVSRVFRFYGLVAPVGTDAETEAGSGAGTDATEGSGTEGRSPAKAGAGAKARADANAGSGAKARTDAKAGSGVDAGTDAREGTSGERDVGSLTLRLPGSGLTGDVLAGRDDVAFVLALLWVTTFDGLVATPAWRTVARAAVAVGAPPLLVYLAALVAGFGVFWGCYLVAANLARRTAPTYVSAGTLARRFAPPLLAIAAGYHLAHFLGFFLSLLPPLAQAVTAPLATVDPVVFVLPDWFGGVPVAVVLVGHVLAVLAAHAVAVQLFPDRLQAVRSQYPVTAAMVGYTILSLWVVTAPEVTPPYI